MNGILRCSRYAFGPNRLHYCGPEANTELKDYINNSKDSGLSHLLKQFQTLYPYLQSIAHANGIDDYFNDKVVEAYWLGNNLLENIGKPKFHSFLVDELQIKKRLPFKEFRWLEEKISRGAVPHHSFHVMNIWRRTGNMDVPHTLESMDECRVSAGVVKEVAGPDIIVEYEPLILESGRLALGAPLKRKLSRRLESEYDIEQMRAGETVSMHWGIPCEVITKIQAETLRKYTMRNIAFANLTI